MSREKGRFVAQKTDRVSASKAASQGQESDNVRSAVDDIPSVFKSRLTKDWFPKDVEMHVNYIVPEALKRLNGDDISSAREIFALLIDIKK